MTKNKFVEEATIQKQFDLVKWDTRSVRKWNIFRNGSDRFVRKLRNRSERFVRKLRNRSNRLVQKLSFLGYIT